MEKLYSKSFIEACQKGSLNLMSIYPFKVICTWLNSSSHRRESTATGLMTKET